MNRCWAVAATLVLLTVPAAAQKGVGNAGVDLTGTYRISTGTGAGGATYSGNVEIKRQGECWGVDWYLDDGTSYSGIGMLLEGLVLAVAWSNRPRASGYGVVVYIPRSAQDGHIGRWCQPDGTFSDESLGEPGALAGTHRLLGGNGAYTGTVEIRPLGSGATYELAWRTSQGDYPGFGIETHGVLSGVWGLSDGGGVVMYAVMEDELAGVWANIGDTSLGSEDLRMPASVVQSVRQARRNRND